MGIAEEILAGKTVEELSAVEARLLLDELYGDYCACLDEGDIEAWPDFFIDACTYKIIPRDNYERGMPIAAMLCESKGYLLDRVRAIRETSSFAPRLLRHFISAVQIKDCADGVLRAEANFAVLQTLADEETKVFMAGRYFDTLVAQDGALKFTEKLCVYDTVLVPNSLIYPL